MDSPNRLSIEIKLFMESVKYPQINAKGTFFRIDLIIIFLFLILSIILYFNPIWALIFIPPVAAILALKIFQRLSLIPIFPRKDEYHSIPTGWKDTKELSQMFKLSDVFTFAIGGELDHHTWLDPTVKDEINKALLRDVDIKLACGPHFDFENIFIAKLANEGKITLYRLDEREQNYHFRVNDKLDVLFHSASDNTKNIFIWYNNLFSGKSYIKYFLKKIEKAHKIEKGTFYKEFRDNLIYIDDDRKRHNITENQEKEFLKALNS